MYLFQLNKILYHYCCMRFIIFDGCLIVFVCLVCITITQFQSEIWSSTFIITLYIIMKFDSLDFNINACVNAHDLHIFALSVISINVLELVSLILVVCDRLQLVWWLWLVCHNALIICVLLSILVVLQLNMLISIIIIIIIRNVHVFVHHVLITMTQYNMIPNFAWSFILHIIALIGVQTGAFILLIFVGLNAHHFYT